MERRPFLSLLAALAAGRGMGAADTGPFTPAADVRGRWDFTPVAGLPDVLLLGDSISIGYTRDVRERLAGRANVYRPMSGAKPENCGDTRVGLRRLDAWLGERAWAVIHFNWGLWDLCYRNPQSKTQGNRDKVHGTLSVPLDDYAANLEALVKRMERTGARLVWASTTVVPENEAGRHVGDDVKYNAAAARVMERHRIPVDDLFALTRGFAGKLSVRPDDVHFTPEGYARLADAVARSIEPLLPPRR